MTFREKLEKNAMLIAGVLSALSVIVWLLATKTLLGIKLESFFLVVILGTWAICALFSIIYLHVKLIKFALWTVMKGWSIGWKIGMFLAFIPVFHWFVGVVAAIMLAGFAGIFGVISIFVLPIVPVVWNKYFNQTV